MSGDNTLTYRDKATRQQAIGIGHCIGQYRTDKRSRLYTTGKAELSRRINGKTKG
jgi:hypothetical protein